MKRTFSGVREGSPIDMLCEDVIFRSWKVSSNVMLGLPIGSTDVWPGSGGVTSSGERILRRWDAF